MLSPLYDKVVACMNYQQELFAQDLHKIGPVINI